MQQVTRPYTDLLVAATLRLVTNYDADAPETELKLNWDAVRTIAHRVQSTPAPAAPPPIVAPAPVVAMPLIGERLQPAAKKPKPATELEWVKLFSLCDKDPGPYNRIRIRECVERAGFDIRQLRTGRTAPYMIRALDKPAVVKLLIEECYIEGFIPLAPTAPSAPIPVPPEIPARRVPSDESLPPRDAITSHPADPERPMRSKIEGGRRDGFQYAKLDIRSAAPKWASLVQNSTDAKNEIKLAVSPVDAETYAGIVKAELGDGYEVHLIPMGQYHRVRAVRR